jgi:hypothetical protein
MGVDSNFKTARDGRKAAKEQLRKRRKVNRQNRKNGRR